MQYSCDFVNITFLICFCDIYAMSIKDRFKMIMDREQLTAGAFAESIDVAQATISHILSSRNNPSTEVILKLHKRYNDINLEWLLTGKGNMSNNSPSTEDSGFDYPLFADNPENLSNETSASENRKEIALETVQKSPKEVVKQEIIYKERPLGKLRGNYGYLHKFPYLCSQKIILLYR